MNKEERLKMEGHTEDEVIMFYHPRDKHGMFSNFVRRPVVMSDPFSDTFLENLLYPTPEHRFQAMKATTPKDHDWVRKAKDPATAKYRGSAKGIQLRNGWGSSYGDLCYYAMLELVTARMQQDKQFRRELKDTGDLLIVEDSPKDDIWGWRYLQDYSGKNLLGLCLMEVRELI